MSMPSKVTLPSSGMRKPEMMSKMVVLPAPFEPMRPRISPWRSWNEVSSTAVMPPKRLVMPASLEDHGRIGGRRRAAGTAATWPLVLGRPPPCSSAAPARNTERTMSSRSSSSAVGPSKRTSPFSRK